MVNVAEECIKIERIANNNIVDVHYVAGVVYKFLGPRYQTGYRMNIMRDCGHYSSAISFGKKTPSAYQIKKATEQLLIECEEARLN